MCFITHLLLCFGMGGFSCAVFIKTLQSFNIKKSITYIVLNITVQFL